MVDVLFGPEVRHILEQNDAGGMKTFCEELHPATVAAALEGEFEVEEVWRFLEHTGIANQASIFEYFPIEWQVEMVGGTGRQHVARLIEQMSPDDRADLLRKLSPAVAEGLLRLVDEANRRDIATLVKYPEGTAGALMTTEYAWLPDNIGVGEALDRLRLQAPDSETIYYVYVLDEQRRREGVISLRDWLRVVRHELLMGMVLGLTLGVIGMACGALVAVLRPDHGIPAWKLGFVVAQAVAAICLWGTLVGSMLPLLFKRINIDPGIASSPSVATIVDVTGILIYFGIANLYFWDLLH